MSSTASTETARKIPGVHSLVVATIRLALRHRWTFAGYGGWLFFPLIAHILVRGTFGTTEPGAVIDTAVSIVALGIYAWCFVALAQITYAFAEQHDAAFAHHAASLTGTRTLPTLVTILLASLATLIGAPLIIPGFVFLVWFAFAGLEAALADRSPFDALSASRELSRGRFFAIAGRVLTFDILLAVVLLSAIVILCVAFGHDPKAVLTSLDPLPLRIDILVSTLQILLLPLWVIYRTLLYLAVKVR